MSQEELQETISQIRDTVFKVCEEFSGEYWRERDRERKYPTEFVTRLTELGLLASLIPEEYGGSGLPITVGSETLKAIHEFGGNAAACHAQMYTMGTVLRHGSEEQKKKYLPQIASGDLRLQAFGVTEPTAGTDTTSITTMAVKDGDKYIVNGQKIWTSRAEHSDLMVLLARTTPKDEVKKKSDGLSVFLIDMRDALKNGMTYIEDTSGTNINVQIFDTAQVDFSKTGFDYNLDKTENKAVIIVMDYAFGEQAYETMDELLKPVLIGNKKVHLDVKSISIMGKAGILQGGKGDVMIPSAHIFEGTADNYPFKNELSKEDLIDCGVDVYEGAMITVLGTSLQNKEILKFFKNSTWDVIGLEMEGAHYQKAIQAASKVRASINEDVKVRYAYYASDNPLETGSTLASGGLGTTGVKPTYVITKKILQQIFNQ